jgi:predicted transcriptional regulator of viral defense system/very-short-patch-repair endonuclease
MKEGPAETSHIGTEVHEARVGVEIAELAERQHGVVAIEQLRGLSLSASGVRSRVARGYLHRVHRGVYAVGRPGLTQNGRRMAAVLAYGPDAVLSHRSAAGLWGLRPDNRPNVELSVPRSGARGRPGIDAHASRTLTADDVTVVDIIPCTTVARTLVDLGDVANRRAVEQAVEQAEVLRLFDLSAVDDALRRAGPRRGTGLLSSVLEESTDPTLTESELEEALLSICRGIGLRDPEVNAWITLLDGTPARIDFLWRAEGIAVETDGHGFHRTRQSRERDARRDQLLRLAGFEPVRFTGRQVARDPGWVAAVLLELIGKRQPLASRAHGDRSGRARAQAA